MICFVISFTSSLLFTCLRPQAPCCPCLRGLGLMQAAWAWKLAWVCFSALLLSWGFPLSSLAYSGDLQPQPPMAVTPVSAQSCEDPRERGCVKQEASHMDTPYPGDTLDSFCFHICRWLLCLMVEVLHLLTLIRLGLQEIAFVFPPPTKWGGKGLSHFWGGNCGRLCI